MIYSSKLALGNTVKIRPRHQPEEAMLHSKHLAPLRTSERVLQHDVLDGKGTSREVQRVLRMSAVLEHGEQIKAATECVAVARPELPLELRVARHASGCPLLAQENRLIGLTSVAAVTPYHIQLRDYGREELVQAVRRDIAHRATEEITFRGPQHRDVVVMYEDIADIVLKKGHEQRVHN